MANAHCWTIKKWHIKVCITFSVTVSSNKGLPGSQEGGLTAKEIESYIDKKGVESKNDFTTSIEVLDKEGFIKMGGNITGTKITLPENVTENLDETSSKSKYKIMLAKGTYIVGSAEGQGKENPVNKGIVTFIQS
jgi:hypothetical protein